MLYKHISTTLVYAALAFYCAAAQSSSPHPVTALTATAKAALAQHALKNGEQGAQEEVAGSSSESHTKAYDETSNTTIAADMNLLSKGEMKKRAAAHFLSFYTIRTHADANVCKAEGVDMMPYIRAYQVKHRAEFARADKLTNGSAFSSAKIVSEVHANREVVEAKARRMLLDIAVALRKTTVADGCAYIADHVIDGLSIQSYAEEFPEFEAILMAD